MLVGRDIVVMSPQWWGDIWVSKHWISHEMSKHNRVLFIGPSIWLGGLLRARTCMSVLRHLLRDQRRSINEKLVAFSPYIRFNTPWRRKRKERRGAGDWVAQVKREISRLGFANSVVINFTTNHSWIGSLGERTSIYYCVDPAFLSEGENEDERLVCEKSDMVFAISENYKNRLSQLVPEKEIHVIGHGTDFSGAQEIMCDQSIRQPKELLDLPRPLVGYVGSIHPSYIDIDFLIQTATKRPNWSFVLIGPYKNNPLGDSLPSADLRKLKQVANIHLLGPKKFSDVPKYIKFFDVGMILLNHRGFSEKCDTRKRTNFKINLYFSQGKPLVSPSMDEYGKIRDFVYVGDTPEMYAKQIEAALNENPSIKAERINYASQFDFQHVLGLISRKILDSEQQKIPQKDGAEGNTL